MKAIELSIITPVYNGQKYMAEFLQRMIDQNCPVMEHIIVDGGSSDRTLDIIKSFANQYAHIRWISEKDRGPGDAINKGLAMARGKYLGILALNDSYEFNTLNEVLGLLRGMSELGFLVGNCKLVDENENTIEVQKPTGLTPLSILFGHEYPYNPGGYFYHKSLHKKVGPYSIEDPVDLDFLLKALSVVKVHYHDKVWVNYRLLPGSISVNAQKSGEAIVNQNFIMERYIKTLPVPQQILVRKYRHLRMNNKVKRAQYYVERLAYYLQCPQRVTSFVMHRLAKAFGKKKGDL